MVSNCEPDFDDADIDHLPVEIEMRNHSRDDLLHCYGRHLVDNV